MSITVGDILRVVCTMVGSDSNIMQNVFNAVVTGSGGPFDDADVVSDLNDWLDDMYGNISVYLPAALDPSESIMYLYDSVDDDWDEIGSDVPTFTSTGALAQLPRGVATLINAKTSDPDVNGKKYIPGPTEGEWDGSTWGGPYLTALAAFALDWYTAFVGSASGATFTPSIWSPTRTNAYVLSGTFVIPTIPAYQRRRKPGVGI